MSSRPKLVPQLGGAPKPAKPAPSRVGMFCLWFVGLLVCGLWFVCGLFEFDCGLNRSNLHSTITNSTNNQTIRGVFCRSLPF